MGIDPIKLMKLKSSISSFQSRHSKFVNFIHAVSSNGVKEGTIIEINVITPEGKKYVSNMKVAPEDVEFLSNLH